MIAIRYIQTSTIGTTQSILTPSTVRKSRKIELDRAYLRKQVKVPLFVVINSLFRSTY